MEEFVLNDKTYSEEELYQIGRLHYPKKYWIKRGAGIALWIAGLDYGVSIPFTIWLAVQRGGPALWLMLTLILLPFVAILVAGTIVFILSFRPEKREVYVDYGKRYLVKLDANAKAREIKLERRRLKELANYKKLLDQGVISQEQYDKKKEELTK